MFSSPFIEERLYLRNNMTNEKIEKIVLVPFYRGAVVFTSWSYWANDNTSSRPLLSRSGCIYNNFSALENYFSDVLVPFYRGAVVFIPSYGFNHIKISSRPLLSRSGCICLKSLTELKKIYGFSSPFIEERLYLSQQAKNNQQPKVLVPFYRGAVVFRCLA